MKTIFFTSNPPLPLGAGKTDRQIHPNEPSVSFFSFIRGRKNSSGGLFSPSPASRKEKKKNYQSHSGGPSHYITDSTSNSIIPFTVTQTIPSPPPTSSKPTPRQSRNRMEISLCAPIIARHRRCRVVLRPCRLGRCISTLEIERFGIVIS